MSGHGDLEGDTTMTMARGVVEYLVVQHRVTSLANVLPLDSQRRVKPVARQSAETQQTT